ncbi:MAG TPA: cell wall hydrolase [Phycisphaerae bacterium]|nr:cell wall hydrolase [Phycisphaerae bacterium]
MEGSTGIPAMTHLQWLRKRSHKIILASSIAALALVAGLGGLALWMLSAPDPVVRVLYCETTICTPRERTLVMGVIQNRIGNPAFGSARTLREVVLQPGAFSCVGQGENWRSSRHPAAMTPAVRKIWDACEACTRSPPARTVGPSGRELVYYHDRSIAKPANWDNERWRAVREVVTEHFVFYSVVPGKRN